MSRSCKYFEATAKDKEDAANQTEAFSTKLVGWKVNKSVRQCTDQHELIGKPYCYA